MTALRIGVVGCGAVSTLFHIPALKACPAANLTTLIDSDSAHAAAVGKRFRVADTATDYRQLVGAVDAAVVATPNATHAEVATYLLENGVHVLCEKPLATSADEARAMYAAAHGAGTRLMAAHSRRFGASILAVKDLLGRGNFGRLERMTMGLGSVYGDWPQRTDFRRQRVAGAGVLYDLGIHLIDLAVWLSGNRCSDISCRAVDDFGWQTETNAEVHLALQDGGEVFLACSYTHPLDRTLDIRGSGGWTKTSVDGAPELVFHSERSRLCRKGGVQRLVLDEADPYHVQVQHFLESVIEGREFIVREDEIVAGLTLLERCYAEGARA